VNNTNVPNLVNSIIGEPNTWVSGIYVLDEAPHAAVIVVSARPDVYEISVHNYSFLGFGSSQFFTYERLVWPVGADLVYRYALCDETCLEIDQEISISEICDEDELYDLESDDVEKIAKLFCPQLSRLVPLSDSEYSLEDLIDDDVETFLETHQGIMTNSTPNFWEEGSTDDDD
jgi:hypothetical protein